MDGEQSTDEAFKYIDLCKNLKVLHVSFAKLINKETLEKINKLNSLKSLTLRHTNIREPNAFKNFFEKGFFEKLKILHLEKCDSLNDDALRYLPIW